MHDCGKIIDQSGDTSIERLTFRPQIIFVSTFSVFDNRQM